MDLLHKQFIFSGLMARLVLYAFQQGYAVKILECLRSPEEAKRLSDEGKGVLHSLHCEGLAVDLALFKDDVLLKSSDDYRILGDFWEGLSDPSEGIVCCWGGSFKHLDGNHFSIAHNGMM